MLSELIKNYLVDTAGVDATKLAQPDLMVSDLGLDSLSLVEMLFEVEDRFGFQISDPMRFQTMSFSAMVTAIEDEVRGRHDGQIPPVEALDTAIAK
ncbi:acyl carrier protein [Ideonella oryzae]|uniref:Acyl carrier protein n=1 Tax=Ideonella oryzae TaxID=2937441 RepID=A0ABT1BIK9_9BURK|nr:acyl carrier protein [Ideonella oryzae]MCO5976040.1 acyl carrier protein [Ideonella oryzae]